MLFACSFHAWFILYLGNASVYARVCLIANAHTNIQAATEARRHAGNTTIQAIKVDLSTLWRHIVKTQRYERRCHTG